MSESPFEPGAVPEASPDDQPDLVPSSDPDGASTVMPAEPSSTNPEADGLDDPS